MNPEEQAYAANRVVEILITGLPSSAARKALVKLHRIYTTSLGQREYYLQVANKLEEALRARENQNKNRRAVYAREPDHGLVGLGKGH